MHIKICDADAGCEEKGCTTPPSEQTVKCETTNVEVKETTMFVQFLRKFTFNDLKSCTRNFRPDSLLGQGGFGCVFKGWIEEHGTAPVRPGTGLTVAVKILNQGGLQGHREWLVSQCLYSSPKNPSSNLSEMILMM